VDAGPASQGGNTPGIRHKKKNPKEKLPEPEKTAQGKENSRWLEEEGSWNQHTGLTVQRRAGKKSNGKNSMADQFVLGRLRQSIKGPGKGEGDSGSDTTVQDQRPAQRNQATRRATKRALVRPPNSRELTKGLEREKVRGLEKGSRPWKHVSACQTSQDPE